ncbi:MAG TPA: hypothetical protein VGD45_05880 [Steroidobacter sp.]|uniref:hypothetical protein n=1 Tax=Steroidobacter sp. TaxID=1978227 RepID=UPI002ED7AA27
MQAEILMSVASAVAAIIGVACSIASIKHKSEAEQQFLDILAKRESVVRLHHLRDQIVRDGVATTKELQRLIDALDAESERLSEEHRRLIIEGLHQPSMRGRARYVAKLMDKAGIGSGAIPTVTE